MIEEIKFDIGQEVFYIDDCDFEIGDYECEKQVFQSYIYQILVWENEILYYVEDGKYCDGNELFITREEAETKLKELQNDN